MPHIGNTEGPQPPEDVLDCARQTFAHTPIDGLVPRNVYVEGRRTSMRLEPPMWDALSEIAAANNCSVSDICAAVEIARPETSGLSSALRVFVMEYFRQRHKEQ